MQCRIHSRTSNRHFGSSISGAMRAPDARCLKSRLYNIISHAAASLTKAA
jgi:hypothetical protein